MNFSGLEHLHNTTVTFFEYRVFRSLAPSQKKIGLVAITILSCLAIFYLVSHCCFRTKVKKLNPEQLKIRDQFKKAVMQDGCLLKYAPVALRDDKEIVRIAVKNDGWSLKFASPALQNDKEIVKLAVQQYGPSLMNASENLQKDPELIQIVISKSL